MDPLEMHDFIQNHLPEIEGESGRVLETRVVDCSLRLRLTIRVDGAWWGNQTSIHRHDLTQSHLQRTDVWISALLELIRKMKARLNAEGYKV